MKRAIDRDPVHDIEIEAAFTQNMSWLHRRLALMVGDHDLAWDIAQETFLRATDNWPIGGRDDLAKWLVTVGTRLCIDEIRRRKRWGFLPLSETSATWALERDPDLWHAICGLDAVTRGALLMTVLEGYTQEEVAGILGVSRGTLASRLSRARGRLREAIGERQYGH
jgi:RNA polymerase sigma-70 factor (ECF subfamily)